MQTKLTLRVDERVVRKAKRLAKQNGSSVSKMFSDFVASNPDITPELIAPPITASMIGVLQLVKKTSTDPESDYKEHLRRKHS